MRKQIEDLDLQTHPREPGEGIEASGNERSQIDKEETGSLTGDKRGIRNPGSGRTAVMEKPRYPPISHRIRENWMWDLKDATWKSGNLPEPEISRVYFHIFFGLHRWQVKLCSKRMSREKAEGDNLDLIPTHALEAGQSFSDGDPSRQNSFAHSLPSSSPEIPGHTSESLPLAKL